MFPKRIFKRKDILENQQKDGLIKGEFNRNGTDFKPNP
jgi:hypothetical protein